jgi:peroxiredoxin
MHCRRHAAQLGKLFNEFKAHNFQILMILGDSQTHARQYADSLHLPFPVLADPGRKVYHRYGLDKVVNIIQRTASVVVDCSGKIRYFRAATNPFVWLKESGEVLDIVKSYASTC